MKPEKILQNRQKKEGLAATLLNKTTNIGKNAEKQEQINDIKIIDLHGIKKKG